MFSPCAIYFVHPGCIPKELGALHKLKMLFVNNNKLTGEGAFMWASLVLSRHSNEVINIACVAGIPV